MFVIMVLIIICVFWYVKFMLFLSSCYYLVETVFLWISNVCVVFLYFIMLFVWFIFAYYMFCNFSSATTPIISMLWVWYYYVFCLVLFVCLCIHTYTLKTHHGSLQLFVCNYSMLWVWYYVFCFMFVLPFAFTHTHTHTHAHTLWHTHAKDTPSDDTLF